MAANDDSRDTINPIGMISVDLAAIGDRDDTPSGKIARLLSTGGKLREQITGTESTLNHNTRWFDQDSYGIAEGFSKLVGYVDSVAREWCSKFKSGKKDECYTNLMAEFRRRQAMRRGGKAYRATTGFGKMDIRLGGRGNQGGQTQQSA